MKKYYSFFKMRFISGLQYRAAAWAGVATQFAWGFMNILLFHAFYKSNPDAFPMGFKQLSSYIWLQQAFLTLFMTWLMETDIFTLITDGGVAYELCRPADLYGMWFARNMAARMSRAFLRCVPVLVVSSLLPAPYGLSLPSGVTAAILFIPSLLLGLLVAVAFCMLIYISTFYTMSPQGIRILATSAVELLSGGIVPLPFLPDGIRQVFEALPFASMQNVPLRIYCGNISGSDAVISLSLQIFWAAAMTIGGWLLMKKALTRVVVQGG
ncbi:MAG: ABC transporter permease [Bacillota bacterium]|nr:ABC transporter permease [Bacillota bacterium]